MGDNKHYILLKDGSYAVSKTEWDADPDKKANGFTDGDTLKIYTNGDYEGGCDYAFCSNGHWYLF